MRIEHLSVLLQLHPAYVQGLVSKPAHPPEKRVINDDLRPAVCEGRAENASVGTGGRADHTRVPAPYVGVNAAGQRHPVLFMALRPVCIQDAAAAVSLQGHVPPDAHIRQHRPPVPAEHVMGLAQVRVARHGGVHAPQWAPRITAAHMGRRRMKFSPQHVPVRAEQSPDGKLPQPVHVAAGPDMYAVQVQVRQGVHALQGQ